MEIKTQPVNTEVQATRHYSVSHTKPVVLIGLMGAGKSTVGKKLAKAMDLPFVDSDHAIEESAGCSISDMFAIHGEPMFRDLEHRVISRLLSGELLVLATGGGAWMQPAVRAVIEANATTVWLKADIEVLLERVSKRSHRPILEQGDKRAILTRLMEERYPVYATADITIDSNRGSQEAVVQRIMDALATHQSKGV